MAKRKSKWPQWDYRSRGLVYIKAFLPQDLADLAKAAAKAEGLSVATWAANLIEKQLTKRKAGGTFVP